MKNPEMRNILETMDTVLVSMKKIITDEMYDWAFELVEHNEPAVAYEFLCSELYEYDTAIPAETWQMLSELGELMNLRPYYWDEIRILG